MMKKSNIRFIRNIQLNIEEKLTSLKFKLNKMKNFFPKLIKSLKYFKKSRDKKTILKKFLLGMNGDGFIYKLMMYIILITIGYVFVYPLFYMFMISLMSNTDLVDSSVQWIPTEVDFTNYRIAISALNMPESIFTTVFVSFALALGVTASSSVIGYGLARYQFPFKKIIFGLMLATFIVPKAVFFISTYLLLGDLGLRDSINALLVPALLGQGEQAAFFILVFYQFFKMVPKHLEEAAAIDGAGPLRVFLRIALPMATPAIIISIVYSFALYWNSPDLIASFMDKSEIRTIPMLLQNFDQMYGNAVGEAMGSVDWGNNANAALTESKKFAGAILSIIPMLLFYFVIQNKFVESIDKSGITGE
jgi:multiple sugar transport system permease protein